MNKVLFLYNPVSGDRYVPKNLDSIISQFNKEGFIVLTSRLFEDDKINLKLIKETDCDFIAASGGDGTLKNIAQYMHDLKSDKPLIPIAAGTCNNFTTNLNYTSDIPENLNLALKGVPRKVDIGLINESDVFLSTFAGGAFVNTSFSTESKLKQALGPIAYYVKPLSELKNLESFEITVETPEQKITESIFLFILMNGRSVGNFENFLNDNNYHDGKMELVLIKESEPVEAADLFLKILMGENWSNHPCVEILCSDVFSISADKNIITAVDGEKGKSLPAEVRVLSKALNVMVYPEERIK